MLDTKKLINQVIARRDLHHSFAFYSDHTSFKTFKFIAYYIVNFTGYLEGAIFSMRFHPLHSRGEEMTGITYNWMCYFSIGACQLELVFSKARGKRSPNNLSQLKQETYENG